MHIPFWVIFVCTWFLVGSILGFPLYFGFKKNKQSVLMQLWAGLFVFLASFILAIPAVGYIEHLLLSL